MPFPAKLRHLSELSIEHVVQLSGHDCMWGFTIVPYLSINFLSIQVYWLHGVCVYCSLLFRHCYDPSLFSELDLQPYWNTVWQHHCVHLQVSFIGNVGWRLYVGRFWITLLSFGEAQLIMDWRLWPPDSSSVYEVDICCCVYRCIVSADQLCSLLPSLLVLTNNSFLQDEYSVDWASLLSICTYASWLLCVCEGKF